MYIDRLLQLRVGFGFWRAGFVFDCVCRSAVDSVARGRKVCALERPVRVLYVCFALQRGAAQHQQPAALRCSCSIYHL